MISVYSYSKFPQSLPVYVYTLNIPTDILILLLAKPLGPLNLHSHKLCTVSGELHTPQLQGKGISLGTNYKTNLALV